MSNHQALCPAQRQTQTRAHTCTHMHTNQPWQGNTNWCYVSHAGRPNMHYILTYFTASWPSNNSIMSPEGHPPIFFLILGQHHGFCLQFSISLWNNLCFSFGLGLAPFGIARIARNYSNMWPGKDVLKANTVATVDFWLQISGWESLYSCGFLFWTLVTRTCVVWQQMPHTRAENMTARVCWHILQHGGNGGSALPCVQNNK